MSSTDPLLEGTAADRAWQAIDAIAHDLEHGEAPASPSLSGGLAGEALFFAELARARDDDGAAEIALGRLEQALDALGDTPPSPALFGGFTGIGWLLSHLEDRLLEPGDDGSRDAVEDALLELLDTPSWVGPYDLVQGLVGFGVYGLEALPRPGARQILERVIGHLAATARRNDRGVYWHSRPEWLPAHQREAAPQGHVDLGLAHGLPGIVALLAAASFVVSTEELTAEAVAGLEAYVRPGSDSPRFPHFHVPGVDPDRSRLAWCYGDLGIAAALASADRATGHTDWRDRAVRLALDAAERSPEDGRVEDAGVCHGAAGVGHLLHRLFRDTGHEALGPAARRWLAFTLELRRSGRGVGGYRAWAPSRGGWVDDRGWLTGAAGVGLVLLTAVTPWDGSWDRALIPRLSP